MTSYYNRYTPLGAVGTIKTVTYQIGEDCYEKQLLITATGFEPVPSSEKCLGKAHAYLETSLDDLRERRRACLCPA